MGINHAHYPEISLKKRTKYRNLIDEHQYQLYNYAQSMCRGCCHIDCINDICTVFSYFMRNRATVYTINLENCVCKDCLVKFKCDRICNDFTIFCSNFYRKLTGIILDLDALKAAIYYLKHVLENNKTRLKDSDRIKNLCYELSHLDIGALKVDQTHTFQAFLMDYNPDDRLYTTKPAAKLYYDGNKIF